MCALRTFPSGFFSSVLCAVALSGCGDGASTEPVSSRPKKVGQSASVAEAFDGVQATKVDDFSDAVQRAGGQLKITMDLSGTELTDEDLAAIVLPKSVTSLDLSNTKITDAGLAHLKKWPQLTLLNLSDNGHTDAAVEHLLAMPNLTHVTFHQPKFSPAKGEELMKVLRARRQQK
jgi:hypothetical protein